MKAKGSKRSVPFQDLWKVNTVLTPNAERKRGKKKEKHILHALNLLPFWP